MVEGRTPFASNIPPVTLNLLIINALLLLASFVFIQTGIFPDFNQYLGLHYFKSEQFNALQLISYMFVHADLSHLFFNMFSLFMFGRTLEQVWGAKRFLTYYLVTGIGAGLIQELVWWYQISDFLSQDVIQMNGLAFSQSLFATRQLEMFYNSFLTVGASGAVFGILLAFGMTFPNARLFLLFIPYPIKAKYMMIAYGVIELFMGVSNFQGDNVAHFAHLGGMIFGYILIRIWKKQDFNNGRYFY